MRILPIRIEQAGPGIDLKDLPVGLAVKLANRVRSFTCVRNAVTLVFDLAGCEHVRLSFAAREYGDEPHAPPPGPFGDDAAFDGVAVSTDGTDWYEVQDLRHLHSLRFTDYDLDLDAASAAHGLSYGHEFRIRFCQCDDNPAPMDGIFVHQIQLTGDLRPPVFHLPMNENGASPTLHDVAAGGLDQVFLDPGGDPSTAAHGVPGPQGTTGLAFDGVDDRIDFGPALLADLVGEGRDFSLAFWYRTTADPGANAKFFFRRAASAAEPYVRNYVRFNCLYWQVGWGAGSVALCSPTGMLNGQWHHIVCRRRSATLSLWVDGVAQDSRTDPNYARNFSDLGWSARAVGLTYTGGDESAWPFALADLRAYDRALGDEEIAALANP